MCISCGFLQYFLPGSTMVGRGNGWEVHLVRHPVDQIVSAYSYHRMGHEYWSREPGRCNFCAEADRAAVFGRCGHVCTYHELLAKLNASEGLVAEFRLQRLTLTAMLANLQAWAGDAVLTVSLQQSQGTACARRFESFSVAPPESTCQKCQIRVDKHRSACRRSQTVFSGVSVRIPESLWRDNARPRRDGCPRFAANYDRTVACIARFLALDEREVAAFTAGARVHDLRRMAITPGHATRTRVPRESD